MARSPSPLAAPSTRWLSTLRTARDLLGALLLVFVVSVIGASIMALAGCPGDTVRRGTTAAVVSAGSVVRALRDENERVYGEAADRLRTTSPTREAYTAAMVRVNATFDTRVRALAVASTGLYEAAELIDLARPGDAGIADYLSRAVSAAVALREAFATLEEPSVLAPVPIPADARASLRRLEQLAGPVQPSLAAPGAR